MKKSDDEFAQQTKELFDESVGGLDAATLSTLNQARQRALATTQHTNVMRWVPAAGVAAAGLAAGGCAAGAAADGAGCAASLSTTSSRDSTR